jgi:hypothetical protein
MRKNSLVTAFAVAAALAPTVAATTARPSLRMVDRTPVIVSGRSFQPEEAVRLRLTTGGRTLTRRALTTASGTFSVRFAVSLGRCATFSLQAFGSTGTRARLFSTAPQPDCSSNG